MSLLQKYYHSYFHDREIGCIPIKPVSIQLTTEAPLWIPPHRYSEQDQIIIDQILQDFVSAKRGRPQTPSAEDINDLAKDDYIFDATSCGLKGG